MHCQAGAFASGVPPNLYEFHFSTRYSPTLSSIQERQFQLQFPGWAQVFHNWHTNPPTCALRPVIPSNACTSRITAAAGTRLAGAYSPGTVTPLDYLPNEASSQAKELYNPRAFFTHAALLHQGFPHCAIFPTAASRRSLDRVSVPVCPIILSDRIPIVALVGLYPTN